MEILELVRKSIDMGLSAVMSVGVLVFVYKFMPKVLIEWHELNMAINKNTQVTEIHYNETVDLKKQLIDIRDKLKDHDHNAKNLSKDQAVVLENQKEILNILVDIQNIVLDKK